MARILCCLIVLVQAFHAQAQCLKMNGQVMDKQSKESLPGANVRFYNHTATGVVTDTNGKFQLDWMDHDSLVISFIGYNDNVIPLPLPCELMIELISSENSLQEVVIQSERLIAEEFTLKKMNKLEIYTNPSAKADPLLAVNSTPSATTTDESANISLRGSSPAETGIFLNNVPINDAVRYAQLNGIGTFSIFNTALISQVQVYPGNPPLEFGNTTSGLIALSTDEVIPERTNTTVSVSLANVGFYTQRKLSNRSSLTAFSNYQPSFAIRWINKNALVRLKDFTTIDLGLHYLLKISDRTTAKIFNYANTESFRYQTDQPTYAGIFQQQKIRNYTIANLRHRMKNSELSWNNGLSFSQADFAISTTKADVKLRDVFTSVNYQLFAARYEFKTGLSYDYRGSDFEGQFPRYAFAVGEQFPVDRFIARQSVAVPEGYVYAKYNLSSKWIVGTGLRKNIPTIKQKSFLSSQINLNFRPATAWNILASAGRYNKFVVSQESESPTYIQTDQYSLDICYTKSKLEGSVSVFYKRGQQSNIASRIKGLEVYARYRFNDHLRTQLSVTSLDAKETTLAKTTSSRYDIHYYFRGNMEYKFAGTWTVTAVFLFRQGSFYTPVVSARYHPIGAYEPVYGDQARLPNYHLIDLSFSKLMIWGEEVNAVAFCGISNLPNFKNVSDYTYNADYTQKTENLFSLRTLYFGCVVNF